MGIKKSAVASEEVEMNMTPMIDIVFQLIIFFMLLTSFATEKITLELATLKTAEDDPVASAGGWRIINIQRSGELFIGKRSMGPGNDKRTWIRFMNELDELVRVAGFDVDGNSNVRVRIRADMGAKWCYTQMVQFCLSQEKIFKIQMASAMDFEGM